MGELGKHGFLPQEGTFVHALGSMGGLLTQRFAQRLVAMEKCASLADTRTPACPQVYCQCPTTSERAMAPNECHAWATAWAWIMRHKIGRAMS